MCFDTKTFLHNGASTVKFGLLKLISLRSSNIMIDNMKYKNIFTKRDLKSNYTYSFVKMKFILSTFLFKQMLKLFINVIFQESI